MEGLLLLGWVGFIPSLWRRQGNRQAVKGTIRSGGKRMLLGWEAFLSAEDQSFRGFEGRTALKKRGDSQEGESHYRRKKRGTNHELLLIEKGRKSAKAKKRVIPREGVKLRENGGKEPIPCRK